MDGFTVGSDDGQSVSLDGDLGRADGSERVDHTEPVATAWRDGEDLERCVGHEARVRIPELALAVDEQRFRILTGVDGQSTRVPFGRILVQPIADQHDVRGQIEVVQMRVRIARWWLTDDDATVQTVQLLQTGMGMPEVCSCITGPLITRQTDIPL